MEEGLEKQKQWQYFLSEKGDWVRVYDDEYDDEYEYEIKVYGRSEWVKVEQDKLDSVPLNLTALSDLWEPKLSKKEQLEKLQVTIKQVFSDAADFKCYNYEYFGSNSAAYEFRSAVSDPVEKLKQQFGLDPGKYVKINQLEGAMNEVIIYGPPFRQLWHSLPATDEGLKAKFENKDPSTDKELTAIAFGLLNDDKKADINPVEELIKILKDRANTIGKWYYWNGKLKATFLKACIAAINDAKSENGSLTLEEALGATVDADSVMGQRFGKRSNQQSLTAENAMNWHRHPSVFHKKKPYTKTYDKADDVCRFSFLEMGL